MIDYSNTIIYKITCNDSTVHDTYVGHTTNFVQRKHAHKQSCINTKSANYKCKVYETIRNNGGWLNWKMEIINFFNCTNHYEARLKEQEYFVLLNANLNSIEPIPPPKPVKIKQTIPITVSDQTNQMSRNIAKKYVCEPCAYVTSNIFDFNKHKTTRKHIKSTFQSDFSTKLVLYSCDKCNVYYKDRSGLWRHKQKCSHVSTNNALDEPVIENTFVQKPQESFDFSIMFELIKQNQEFKELLVEQNKQIMELAMKIGNTHNI